MIEDAELDIALRELGGPVPAWAGTSVPPLRRAEHMREDPFREREAWLLHYDDVVLAVGYDHRTGLPLVELACVLPEDRDDLLDAVEDAGATKPTQAHRPLVAQSPPAGSAVRLTVTLLDVAPPVWRRLVVPADVSLARLHRLVQAAMGWADAHSHEWEVAGDRVRGPAEERLRLAEAARRTDRLTYTYDFGDDWRHELRLAEVLPPPDAGDVPRLEAGERARPPEDVGGPVGYQLLLDACERGDIAEDDQLVDQFGAVWSPAELNLTVAGAWDRVG